MQNKFVCHLEQNKYSVRTKVEQIIIIDRTRYYYTQNKIYCSQNNLLL
jgi:uncharacterized protein YnzC (UPF0291/DUF896 family)